jgi:hypothetical protein
MPSLCSSNIIKLIQFSLIRLIVSGSPSFAANDGMTSSISRLVAASTSVSCCLTLGSNLFHAVNASEDKGTGLDCTSLKKVGKNFVSISLRERTLDAKTRRKQLLN